MGDNAGNIWFTANNSPCVGKLDPKTGEVTEYHLNDPNTRGPHTPIFDQNGTPWFTLHSDLAGRVIPLPRDREDTEQRHLPVWHRGEFEEGNLVRRHSRNRIGSINPQPVEIPEQTLPTPVAPSRRIAPGE